VTRVLVAGAGALGSVLGGFLRQAGLSVTLLGRNAHTQAILQNGLTIDGIWGAHRMTGFGLATSAEELSGTFDAVLLTVKSYDTKSTAEAVRSFLAPEGVMISLQNGLGNVEQVEQLIGPERSLGARVIFGAVLVAPGHARVTVFADPNAVGALRSKKFPRRERAARRWAEIFDRAGVPSVYTDNLEAMLWAKVFYNAALNPLGALLGVHYGALPEHDDSRAIMNRAIDETYAVALAEQVELPWSSSEEYRREFYERLVPATFDHRSSMLQDLERGRRTEVDAINGEVWRRGRLHDIVTPVNEMLARLIHLRENRELKT
jgi:2-dehydropantoate 2-reductase